MNKAFALTLLLTFTGLSAKAIIALDTLQSCICPGSPSQPFAVIAEGTAGPFSFSWSCPVGYTSIPPSPDNITEPGLYTVDVFNAFGCATTLSVYLEPSPRQAFLTTYSATCPHFPHGGCILHQRPLAHEFATGFGARRLSRYGHTCKSILPQIIFLSGVSEEAIGSAMVST
ncbi:MAG: hypothetical protein KDD02_16860 [Phaeodactylibacter sp.]|nr:hypothetical protein [Phaeodactylibacter sp.]